MKKIILFLVLVLIVVPIQAKTYYSDYSEAVIKEEALTNSDTIQVTPVTMYRFYNLAIENGPYALATSSEYPYINYSDIKGGEFSEWSDTNPVRMTGRVVQTKEVTTYKDLKEIRYISLTNVQGNYGAFRISELEIYAGDEAIAFDYTCHNCNANFDSYIKNGKIYENMSYLYNGGDIIIDLNNYYPADSLKIKLYLFDQGSDCKLYQMHMSGDSDQYYLSNNIVNCFKDSDVNEIIPFEYTANDFAVDSGADWYEPILVTEPITSSATRLVETQTLYRYSDQTYRTYRKVKQYMADYALHGNADYPMCDYSSAKIYYQIQTRHYVTLAPLLITSRDTSLTDLILDSDVEASLEGQVDVYQNGTYEVTLNTPFGTYNETLEVQIEQNTIDNYEKIIASLKDQMALSDDDYQAKLAELNKQMTSDQTLITNLKATLKDKDNELTTALKEVETSHNQVLTLTSEVKEKNNQITTNGDVIMTLQTKVNSLIATNQNLEDMISIKDNTCNNNLNEYQAKITSLQNDLKNQKDALAKTEVKTSSLLGVDNQYLIGYVLLIIGILVAVGYFLKHRRPS